MSDESRKWRKHMPVLPVASGELTLQDSWVPADQSLVRMIIQSSKAQAERAS